MGRRLTTGKFETRSDLVSAVWMYYEFQSMAQVARTCRVSQQTVINIINQGKPNEETMATRKKTAVVKAAPAQVPATQSVHPGPMILKLAERPDLDPDKLLKLFDLQERYDEKVAREAYYEAMAKFRGIVPQITYDSWVNYANKGGGRTDFAFASLAGILEKIQDAMRDCGLTVSWMTGQADGGGVVVTCVITHAMGHSESTSLSADPDQSGGKNSIQAVKSTVSYLRRITLEAMLGLAAKHDDDDGNLGVQETIEGLATQDEIDKIRNRIQKLGADEEGLCKALSVSSLEALPLRRVKEANTLLDAKEKVAS